MRKIIVMCLMVMAIAACTSLNCPVQTNVLSRYSLLKANGTADTLGLDTLWLWTKRSDQKDTILNALTGSNATSFELPMSHILSEDTICLALKGTSEIYHLDTIRIKKENYPHFESVDCQAAYFHKLTDASVTHNAFDSISIHYSTVDYDISNYHFYLYLKKDRD